ncbi:FUSC family protein [Paraburkholderia sp. DHOC27]|uniref:FUSC family protein n=1 Tax=Paraburkholderia sp. DHOC27 TaxID=2303330 RepID=UPI000E3BEB54|nr:FUSC family protein [Paraburkholderia sp. DHOC27]RFU45149.1 FUSC family protein [Paraburkholderia sp. DHOC27]
MIAAAFSRVAGRLLVADPGLVRLQTALRVALACLLSGTVSIAWTAAHHLPVTLVAPAVLFSMIAPLFVRDARRGAWFITLLCLYVCGCVCFAVAAGLSHAPLAGDAGFLLVMFVGMLCQACGPRALGCVLIAVVTYYLGLYLHPTLMELVQTLALSVVGPLAVALAGRVLVPMHAARTLRLAIHTVTLRAERLLATRQSTTRQLPPVAQLSALNEAALALEEQLALLDPPNAAALRERLVDLKVAAGQSTFNAAPDTLHNEPLRRAVERLRNAVRPHHTAQAVVARRSRTTRGIWFADLRAKLCWLPAVRTTSAALLAMLIGHSLSPERWFWAVITTFVVFLGTRSRADTVYRGAQRLAGTLAGALASMILVAALHAAPMPMIVVMLLCVFGWAYYILNSYARGVFFITVLVGLVYGQLGFAIGPLVELRIEEVLVGCVVSFAVAILMMPLAATRHVEARLGAVLVALRQAVVLATATQRADAASATTLMQRAAAMRALDRSWHELRVALRPLQTQRVFVWNPGIELATGSLLSCLHWVRVLSRVEGASDMQHHAAANAASTDTNARHAVASILSQLDTMLGRYHGVAARVDTGAYAADASVSDAHQLQALAQLEGAVAQLAERLAQPNASMHKRLNWALRFKSA